MYLDILYLNSCIYLPLHHPLPSGVTCQLTTSTSSNSMLTISEQLDTNPKHNSHPFHISSISFRCHCFSSFSPFVRKFSFVYIFLKCLHAFFPRSLFLSPPLTFCRPAASSRISLFLITLRLITFFTFSLFHWISAPVSAWRQLLSPLQRRCSHALTWACWGALGRLARRH